MSEIENTGATDTGSADSGSAASSPAPIPGAQNVKDKAFAEMAKSEDIGDWIKEERDRKAEDSGDASVDNPLRKQERLDRIRRALDRARQEGEPAPSGDESQHHVEPQAETYDRDAEIRRARVDAQFELRANQFMAKQPDFEHTVREVFSVIPPGEALKEAISESPLGPEVAYLFAQHPEAIEEINQLPPQVAARVFGIIEGRLAHERAAQQQTLRQPQRRASRAPTPMKQLSGGASPGKSLAEMSKGEDASAMIDHWRKQKATRR
jgi:hypothetical protein